MTQRIWLTYPETGGAFACPVDAVDDWKSKGWVEGDAPPPVNPVTQHRKAVALVAPADETSAQAPVDDGAQPTAKPATSGRGTSSKGSD